MGTLKKVKHFFEPGRVCTGSASVSLAVLTQAQENRAGETPALREIQKWKTEIGEAKTPA